MKIANDDDDDDENWIIIKMRKFSVSSSEVKNFSTSTVTRWAQKKPKQKIKIRKDTREGHKLSPTIRQHCLHVFVSKRDERRRKKSVSGRSREEVRRSGVRERKNNLLIIFLYFASLALSFSLSLTPRLTHSWCRKKSFHKYIKKFASSCFFLSLSSEKVFVWRVRRLLNCKIVDDDYLRDVMTDLFKFSILS